MAVSVSMGTHRQVSIAANGWVAEVDEGIAPLILAMWERGLATDWSCQGGDDEAAYLAMPADSFAAFLGLAAGVLGLGDYLEAARVITFGDAPEGLRFVEPDCAMGTTVQRREDGWVVMCSLRFRPELIPALATALREEQ